MSTDSKSSEKLRKQNKSGPQWNAAKFYLRAYKKQHPLSSLTYVAWVIGGLLQWSLPSLVLADIISNLQAGVEINYLVEISKMLGLFVMGQLIAQITLHFMSYWQVKAADGIIKGSYASLLNKSLAFHADNFAGSIATKMTKLSGRCIAFTDTMHFNVGDYVAALLFTMFILGKDGVIGLAMLIATLFVYSTIAIPLVKRRLKIIEERTREESKRTGVMIDGVSNILAIKSFGREKHEKEIFNKQTDMAGNLVIKSWIYNVWRIDPLTGLFYLIMAYVPLIYVTQTSNGSIDGGRIFIVYLALANLGAKIWDISKTWRNIEQYLAECAEGLELLSEPDDVQDSQNAVALSINDPTITFEDMDFGYEGISLYEDFNLSINAHEKVGLVGPSGGGKTTLVKLIMRFMNVTGGSINISGVNISNVTQLSLRENISYIPQEPALFHRSIKENIEYGNPSASDDQIISAAKKAHAHDFIKDLKHGYNTIVGERGVKLSGGQRQRVAIARAFLKDAPILILDEATSALDSESEIFIQEALVKLMEKRTVISIAHRLSTLQIMDSLVVIEDGKITEQGSHAELLKNKGKYSELWAHQSGGFIEE